MGPVMDRPGVRVTGPSMKVLFTPIEARVALAVALETSEIRLIDSAAGLIISFGSVMQ